MTAAHSYELGDAGVLPALLRGAVDDAERGEVVYLTRGQRRVAALVPAELATAVAAAVEALEDAEDNAAADAALAEDGPRYSHESVKTELGLG